MMDYLLLPFQFDFMRFALAIAIIVAIPTALLSCLLVLKGWALLGDAISHAVFPGVVIAYIVGIPFGIGAFVAGMGCALATGYLSANSRIKQDTIMGIVFSSMFAAGLLIYAAIQSDVHLDHILFGDILGIGWPDIWQSGAIALLITAAIAMKWRDMLLHAFDPLQARTSGLWVNVLHYGLLAAVSLAVVASLQAVGIVLSIALLIAPGAVAFLLTRSFGAMLLVAVAVAVTTAFCGVYLSFYLNSGPAPTIVLLLSLIFVMAFAYKSLAARKRVISQVS